MPICMRLFIFVSLASYIRILIMRGEAISTG